MLEEILETWEYYHSKTIRFIEFISDEHLAFKPFQNSKTLGYMLNHLGDVFDIYVRVCEEKRGISWDEKREDQANEASIERLLQYFRQVDDRFQRVIPTIDTDASPHWTEMGDPTYEQCLRFMLEHEIYFHGILRMYVEGLNLDFDFRL